MTCVCPRAGRRRRLTCSADIDKAVIEHTYSCDPDRRRRIPLSSLAGICLDNVDSAIGERGFCRDDGGIRREFVSAVGSVARTGWEMTIDFQVTGRLFYSILPDVLIDCDMVSTIDRILKSTQEE